MLALGDVHFDQIVSEAFLRKYDSDFLSERTRKEVVKFDHGAAPPYSALTSTLRLASTSGCSLTGTVNSPSCLIGSARWILRRSTANPFSRSPRSISILVTEPN